MILDENLDNSLSLLRYLELLLKDNKLLSEGSSLREKDDEEYMEFLDYGIIIENHVHYTQKDKYVSLVADYLVDTKKLLSEGRSAKFASDFIQLQRKTQELIVELDNQASNGNYSNLLALSIDKDSEEGFSDVIGLILEKCEQLTFGESELDLEGMYFKVKRFFGKLISY
jgi:hypothetical protein